jgi:hypothetical protein
MISDVMHDAIFEVDRYLKNMPDVYDFCLHQVMHVRREMEELRILLDTPPLDNESANNDKVTRKVE